MVAQLDTLKAELERFGKENDAGAPSPSARMLNITRDTGEFLAVLVRIAAAQRVLEIGTSNGYSTLWLAEAASATGGAVTTVERADEKVKLARANFARAGLARLITVVHGDAGQFLRQAGESAYDLVFLDSERGQYPGWWTDLRRVLRMGGILVVDNATSHAAELAPLVALVKADLEFATCLASVGKGELLAVKTVR